MGKHVLSMYLSFISFGDEHQGIKPEGLVEEVGFEAGEQGLCSWRECQVSEAARRMVRDGEDFTG